MTVNFDDADSDDDEQEQVSSLPAGARNYMTPGGFGRMKDELERLVQKERPELVATVACYGSGGCGGIFAPLLFFGGMAGALVSGLTAEHLGLTGGDQTLLALMGMTACLGAVVRAPLTSILIVMEMTRQIYALPALMVAAVAA